MSRRTSIALLTVCFAASVFCVIYPVYVIRPWRHQREELKTALVAPRCCLWPMCRVSASVPGRHALLARAVTMVEARLGRRSPPY